MITYAALIALTAILIWLVIWLINNRPPRRLRRRRRQHLPTYSSDMLRGARRAQIARNLRDIEH